jgi:hypothetical protein
MTYHVACFKCGKTPEEIDEYVACAEDEGCTPTQYVIDNEGTLNRETGRFACTDCYVEIGSPSAPGRGWVAP